MNSRAGTALILITLFASFTGNADAYIGPGAGFAFLSSFFILFVTLALAVFFILSWPFRLLIRGLFRRQRRIKHEGMPRKVIIVGLDGMDPKLTQKYLGEGKLPNLRKLQENGSFAPLSTTFPSISPVAWSSFMTGVDPSHHNIFDFITRDPRTYAPVLSSAEIGKASKVLSLGNYLIPLGKSRVRLLRKSKPFWRILGENDVFSSVLRVPITFPPEKFNGVLLSGMCVPDMIGSQGTFSFYTTNGEDRRGENGGVRQHVSRNSNTIETWLYGPANSLLRNGDRLKVPLSITLEEEKSRARIRVSGHDFLLETGTYSPWMRITMKPGLGLKVQGICRFYLNCIAPDFELYVSPINIDPEKPALPIAYPFFYSVYLSKLNGPYSTLGLAEDTWALNEGILNEDAFLKQAYLLFDERQKMFFHALERTPEGLCVCVFDTPDRIQHMFFRCLDDDHPANKGKEVEKYRTVIEDLYVKMDTLIGRVMEKADDKTVVIVMSDHGFTHFKRGVNLNSWLFQNGYLKLSENRSISGDWFDGVDWERTRAFSLGLTGIFINRRGRESCGIVEEGEELKGLKQELIAKLRGLVDDGTSAVAIRDVVDTESAFSGPYTYDAVDLLIGYNAGYRSSWASATGRVTEAIFEDNTKHWSGDHSVHPNIVPGVFFTNRKINTLSPNIKDISATVLKLFGVEVPPHMKGRPLMDETDAAMTKTGSLQ